MKILVFIAGRSKIEVCIFGDELLVRYCLKCCNFDHSRSLCEKQEEEKENEIDLEIVENYDLFFKCPKCNFWNEKKQVCSQIYIFNNLYSPRIPLSVCVHHTSAFYVKKN